MKNDCEGKGMDEYGSLYDQLAIKSCLIFTVSASREVFLQRFPSFLPTVLSISSIFGF